MCGVWLVGVFAGRRVLESSAGNFNRTQIGDSSRDMNAQSLIFPQYCLGVGLSVKALTMSMTLKYHSSSCHIFLILLF